MPWRTPDIVYVVGFAAGYVVRKITRRGHREERTESTCQTRLDSGFLLMGLMGMLVAPVVYLLTPCLRFADYAGPPWMTWVGGAAFAGSILLLWLSHRDLGRNWAIRIRIREGHSLVTTGVYSRVRHPMYTALLLWATAQALLLQNWLAGPAYLAAFIPSMLYRIPREERMMVGRFGEEYQEYMARTGRLFPPLGR